MTSSPLSLPDRSSSRAMSPSRRNIGRSPVDRCGRPTPPCFTIARKSVLIGGSPVCSWRLGGRKPPRDDVSVAPEAPCSRAARALGARTWRATGARGDDGIEMSTSRSDDDEGAAAGMFRPLDDAGEIELERVARLPRRLRRFHVLRRARQRSTSSADRPSASTASSAARPPGSVCVAKAPGLLPSHAGGGSAPRRSRSRRSGRPP